MRLEPTIKQYKALMYLGALPLKKEGDDGWHPITNSAGLPEYDLETTMLGFGGAAGGGKSFIGCYWVAQMANRFPGTRWFLAREEIKKVKESTLLTFFDVLGMMGMKAKRSKRDNGGHFYFNNVSGVTVFANGSTVSIVDLSYEPSDPLFTRFGSTEYTGGFIDEANECPYAGVEILQSRIRYKLEAFCPYCSGDMTIKDRVGEEQIYNPKGKTKGDEYIDKNVYICPSCKRKNYGLLPRMLCTFNPDKGWVYNLFYRPYIEGSLPDDTKFIQALVWDNKYISKAYINNLRGLRDKVTKERLLNGSFEYDNTPGRLFDYDVLNDMFDDNSLTTNILDRQIATDPAFAKEVEEKGKGPSTGYLYRITCDPARHGRDFAVITVWNDRSIEEIYVYGYSDTNELRDRIMILWDKYNIGPNETLVDDDGVGGGLVDALGCRGFINNAGTIQPPEAEYDPLKRLNYHRLKDQCYFTLAENIDKVAITETNIFIFNTRISGKGDTEITAEQVITNIIDDLDAIVEVDIDKDNSKRIISKDALKQKLGRSPDFGDCIMFRAFWEVHGDYTAFVL